MRDNEGMKRLAATGWLGALLALPAVGLADDAKSRARELAIETGELLDAGNHAEALERVEEAEKLYHAPTHLQMKGEALEGLGRLAEAMAVYERLEAEPIPSAATQAFRDAKAHATKRLRALMAVVPSLLVRVNGSDEARATLDGEPFAIGGEAARRVDAGEHHLVVEADGYEPVSRDVTLAEKGGVKVVEVTLVPLGDDPIEPVTIDEPAPDVTTAEDHDGSVLPGAIVLGVGGAVLAVGAILGGVSLAKVGDLEEACPDKECGPDQQPTIDSVEDLGNASTALFVVGGAAAATGVVLLIVRPGGGTDAESSAVAPLIGPGFVGLRGWF